MLPCLTVIADFVGLLGGYVIAVPTLGLSSSQYWTTAYQALAYNDLVQGLLKPFLFAFVISLVGCFYGLRTSGGTQGVGLATTKAVVVSMIWVFIVTSLVTRVFVNLH
jgi:phospholipid/cholesterol/gamma-HCH transport system permease protein